MTWLACMKVGPKERNGQSLLSRRHVAGGETGADNRLLQALLERTGVTILGKRMFEEGEHNWPEEAPFHTPVFVLTHEVRKPWERKGEFEIAVAPIFLGDGLRLFDGID